MTAFSPASAPEDSDDALLARLNDGDHEAAIGALQERHGPQILRFVRRRLQDEHLAQDVTQEVFARVFFKSHLYRPNTNFRAWLFEIARNQVRSAIRVRRRQPRPLGSVGDDDDRPVEIGWTGADRSLEEAELLAAFEQACSRLPECYARPFDLCARRGFTYQQAADHLGVPTGTIGIRIMRARKRLFRSLARHVDRLRRPPACVQ